MNYLKAFGLGALLWLIMFAGISAIMPWYTGYMLVRVIVLLIAAGLAYWFASIAQATTYTYGLIAGVMWVLTSIVMDAVITLQFNATVFSSGWLWAGYAVTLVMPLVYAAISPAAITSGTMQQKRAM